MSGNPFGIALGLIVLVCIALLVLWLISMFAKGVVAHIYIGQRAREQIDLMWADKDYNRGLRPVAFVIYYLISWTSYISMLIAFFTGIWVVNTYLGWIRGDEE